MKRKRGVEFILQLYCIIKVLLARQGTVTLTGIEPPVPVHIGMTNPWSDKAILALKYTLFPETSLCIVNHPFAGAVYVVPEAPKVKSMYFVEGIDIPLISASEGIKFFVSVICPDTKSADVTSFPLASAEVEETRFTPPPPHGGEYARIVQINIGFGVKGFTNFIDVDVCHF